MKNEKREGTEKISKGDQKTGKHSPQKKYKGFKMIELTMRWKTVTAQKVPICSSEIR